MMDHVLKPMMMDNILHLLYMLHGGVNFNMIEDLKVVRQWIVEFETLIEEQHQTIEQMELFPSTLDSGGLNNSSVELEQMVDQLSELTNGHNTPQSLNYSQHQ